MKELDIEKLKFPIGVFEKPDVISKKDVASWIASIESFPQRIKFITESLSLEQLNWIYRPNGWCIKQVVHHCADSHMNSLIRFKLALTEEIPVIKSYHEDKWAVLADGFSDDILPSIQIIQGIHARWVLLLKSFGEEELKREFLHPSTNKKATLAQTIGVYAWHCEHHLTHIEQALFYKGKF